MEAATARYLRTGPAGYWKQALTGIPVKVFAAQSGRQDLSLAGVLVHAAGERAARMGAATGLVVALNRPLGPITRQHYGLYLTSTAAVFGVALRGVVRSWKRR